MADLKQQILQIQKNYGIIGRSNEILQILIAFNAKKNILIEGETGTSKTTLARAIAAYLDKRFYRIDGSEDVLSHVLVGYFDPPLVINKGYNEDAFIYGPLSNAMRTGGILFINELNRLPESTQNVLLSALDEGYLDVPKLGSIKAKNGFFVITTMNPAAHVGVTNLGEALKDRFVWLKVGYQSESEEKDIIIQKVLQLLRSNIDGKGSAGSDGSNGSDGSDDSDGSDIANLKLLLDNDHLIDYIGAISARIINLSREHGDLRRGASVRAGIDLASIAATYSYKIKSIKSNEKYWYSAALMALSSKIEIEDGAENNLKEIIEDLVNSALKNFQ